MTTRPEGWIEDLAIQDANIKWPFSNFAGLKKMYSKEGEHYFVVILDNEQAAAAEADGWNVKLSPGRDETEPDEWHIQIEISDTFGMPSIWFVTEVEGVKRKILVTEIGQLAQIRRDMVNAISFIAKPGKLWLAEKASAQAGYEIFKRTAYLKEMYVEMVVSDIASKYAGYEEIRPGAANE